MGVSQYNTVQRDSILTNALQHKGSFDNEVVYGVGDVVVDGQWVMCANTETQERAAPQPNGEPTWSVEGQTFAEVSNDSVIWTGHRYAFLTGGWVQGVRVWVPELTANTNYRIIIIRNPDGANPLVTYIEEPVLNLNDWTVLGVINSIITAGEELVVILDSLNSGADQTITGGWTYGGTSSSAPALQNWNKNSSNNTLRISLTDLDSTDRTTELQGIIPNSTIRFASTVAPTNYQTFLVNGVGQLIGDYIEYPVALIDSVGSFPTATATTMTATVPLVDTTKYVQQGSFWPTNSPPWATVEGYKEFDGVPQAGFETHAFGVDLKFQPAYVSPHWNLISYNNG